MHDAGRKGKGPKRIDAAANDVRILFSQHLNRVAFGSERIGITRHGKLIAGLVSSDDLELLEALDVLPTEAA